MNKGKFLLSMLLLTATSTMMLQNCGTRVREAELDANQAQVEEYLAHFKEVVSLSQNNAIALAALKTFDTLRDDPGHSLYYAEAPSSMGRVGLVIDLDYNNFLAANSTAQIGAVASDKAFFVVTKREDGFRGALILAGEAAITGQEGAKEFVFISTNDDGVQAASDTQSVMPPGVMTDEDFVLPLNLRNEKYLIVRSDDLSDDDLADVIQLKLYEVEDGQEVFLGRINMAQPLP